MAVIAAGEFVRIRWCRLNDAASAALEQLDVTLQTVTALMEDQPSIWGLTAGQEVTLSGKDFRERGFPAETYADIKRMQARIDEAHAAAVAAWPRNFEDDEGEWEPYPSKNDQLNLLTEIEREAFEAAQGWDTPFKMTVDLPDDPIARTWTGPGPGRSLVLVQNAAHCWAALRGVEQAIASDIGFAWTRIALPGAEPIVLATPGHPQRPFDLVYPPSTKRERQAVLDRSGHLRTLPFRPVKGGASVSLSPVYRVGLLDDRTMHWLDVKPGDYSVTATPTTALFRSRLELFRRELASRGIFYQDDAEETGYELRWAIEDGAVPNDFHEPDAVEAYTVSGEGAPEEDKRDQAIHAYDPGENREELDWLRELGTFRMPARIDVPSARLLYSTRGKVDGIEVNEEWMVAHLDEAGVAAGIDTGASTQPSLTTAERNRAANMIETPSIDWNAVDAADRVQRAAYLLATGGKPDPAVEKQLARLRGPIVRALLARDVLQSIAESGGGTVTKARPTTPPLAPGPFPQRAYAMIALADRLTDQQRRDDLVAKTLSIVVDPLERQLARLFAGRMNATLAADTIAERARVWDDARYMLMPKSIADLTMTTVEKVLGSLEPPSDINAEDDGGTDRHVNASTLRHALHDQSVGTFARAWSETPSVVQDEAGLWLLMEAVRTEAFDIAAFLVDHGVPIAGRAATANNALGQWGGKAPLGVAVETGSVSAVLWCLEHGSDPAAAEWTRDETLSGEEIEWPTPALVLAAKYGHADILRRLLEQGGDPAAPIANGITPLTAAAFGGNPDCVELLLASGADANQPLGKKTVSGSPISTTPLLYACDRGHDAIVHLLLDRGADPRVVRGDGELALQLAMQNCRLSILKALVSAGADAAAVNSDGVSVLHTAMLKRRADAIPLLLAAGAPIDLPTGDRAVLADIEPAWTGLMIAAAHGDGTSVALLLEGGADPLAVDGEDRTALDLARLAADPDADIDPYDEVIALLENAERAFA